MPSRSERDEVSSDDNGLVLVLNRIANLLAMSVVQGLEPHRAMQVLEAAGYRHAEISRLLGVKANTVTKALNRLKQSS